MKNKTVTCDNCGKSSETDDIIKSCGNCFACVGCEIYICPWCENPIVVKPIQQASNSRNEGPAGRPD